MIEQIRRKIQDGSFEYSLHAAEQSILRRISRKEVEEAMESGEIIKHHPSDKYGPSCLVFGMTGSGRPLHVQCTHPDRERVKIITPYEPSAEEWIEHRTRR